MVCLVGWQTVPYFWLEMSVGRRCWLTMSVAKLTPGIVGPTMTAVWHALLAQQWRPCGMTLTELVLLALDRSSGHSYVKDAIQECDGSHVVAIEQRSVWLPVWHNWLPLCLADRSVWLPVTQLAAFVPCWLACVASSDTTGCLCALLIGLCGFQWHNWLPLCLADRPVLTQMY